MDGRHRIAETFAAFVARAVEVGMGNTGPAVHRVVCAVDCGIAIDPDTVRAQMEGAVGFAAALRSPRRSP